MSRFKIITPVPNWEGNVGERETGVPVTRFMDGEAELSVVDQGSASRLAYFRSAGYRIEALDDVSVDDAIRSAVLTVGQEADALEAENAELRKVNELDKLREENAKLREQVDKRRADTLAADDKRSAEDRRAAEESAKEPDEPSGSQVRRQTAQDTRTTQEPKGGRR